MTDPTHRGGSQPPAQLPPPPPPAGGFGAHDGRLSQPPAQLPPPPVARSKGMPGWAIALLITTAMVFLVIGPLAALAISSMHKFMAAAKTAEAKNSLGVIARGVAQSYEAEDLTPGAAATNGPAKRLCPSATSPVPTDLSLVSGRKYQSRPDEWERDKEAKAGFSCAGFSMTSPQYYQYDYQAQATTFTATALGDLDGNGTFSEFKLGATVVDGVVRINPNIEETRPSE